MIGGASKVDTIKQAQVPLNIKVGLLNYIWESSGPLAVLSVGSKINDVEYDPIWRSAIRSENPEILLKKWHRFEVFAHSKNRVGIECHSNKKYSFHRYTVDGGTPTAPENLLICGLLIALLERVGCQGLKCQMSYKKAQFAIRENGKFYLPLDIHLLDTNQWGITWDDFETINKSERSNFDEYVEKLFTAYDVDKNGSLGNAAHILMRDVARVWKVEKLAREVGLSKRSFQRKLHNAGLSFSHLIRMVRVDEACRLLKKNEATVTAVGFCAGFSDSAHFSRDFRASMGMTPTDYRKLWDNGDR